MRRNPGRSLGKKRVAAGIALAAGLLLLPDSASARSRVYFRVSVGGGAVAGAAVIVWGISYSVGASLSGSAGGPNVGMGPWSSPEFRIQGTGDHRDAMLDANDFSNRDRIEFYPFRFRW